MNRYICVVNGRARSSFRSRCVDAVAVVAVAADADADDADNIPEMSKKCHNRKPSVLPLRATQKNSYTLPPLAVILSSNKIPRATQLSYICNTPIVLHNRPQLR